MLDYKVEGNKIIIDNTKDPEEALRVVEALLRVKNFVFAKEYDNYLAKNIKIKRLYVELEAEEIKALKANN